MPLLVVGSVAIDNVETPQARRDGECAKWFIDDIANRLANRVQLTSDGHKAYLEAVEGAFGADIDYAMLVKVYGEPTGAMGRPALQKFVPGEVLLVAYGLGDVH
jgi:hypothetical protein